MIVSFRMSVLMERKKVYETGKVSLQKSDASSVEYVKQMPRPRFIKTHLPFSLLPEQIQNGTRSPKVCILNLVKNRSKYFRFIDDLRHKKSKRFLRIILSSWYIINELANELRKIR